MSDEDRDGTFKGTIQEREGETAGTVRGTFLADDEKWARLRDRMFVTLAIFAMLTMALTSYFVVRTNQTVSEINKNQVAIVQAQNDLQICTQHDIVHAVKSIGRKLGLPVDDIALPDTTGLDCP